MHALEVERQALFLDLGGFLMGERERVEKVFGVWER